MAVRNADETLRQEAARKEIHTALPLLLPRLRRFCRGLAGSLDGGDDLCQEAIARALAGAGGFERGSRLDRWIFRIARNIQIDSGRRRRTRGEEVDVDYAESTAGDDGRQVTEARSDLARVRSGFRDLPEDQRMLMLLVVVEGFSYKDAAETLEIPLGTVMSRLSRARKALDRCLHGGAKLEA